ncbi:MAG: YbfB/YjiJ family MFS transporter [Alphaproteobacteria bacterium]|nr:YbfB/YjiJ family MFS transporter [Alphaproteobacteria bacterium]
MNTYRFLICFALGLSATVAVGLARFAYALILPAMRESFAWSYVEAGALNAVNAAGYLVGALVASRIIAKFGTVPTFIAGTAITSLTVLLTASADLYAALLVLRLLPGIFGAIAFIAGGVLATHVASHLGPRASLAIGFFYAGPGVGIVISGAVVPPLLMGAPANWPLAWIGLGAASLVLTGIAALAVRYAGEPGAETTDSGTDRNVSLTPALISYTLYAAGYIGYMTFIIVSVRESGGTTLQASLWWVILGIASVVSFFLWQRVLAAGNGRSLGLLTGATGIAALLPVIDNSPLLLLLSFALFGATFLVVVAATTNLVRLARAPDRWPQWIGYFTIAFGLGQTVGPIVGGLAADILDNSDGVLWVSAALLIAGGFAALLQRNVKA